MNNRRCQFHASVMVCSLLVFQGCASSRPATSGDADRPVCPPAFQQTANALISHFAYHRRWPSQLEELRGPRRLPDVPPERLARYGYAGRPLGVLLDGRWVMLVNDQVNEDGSVWSVVQTPPIPPALPMIDVVAVPWDELELAAAQAE